MNVLNQFNFTCRNLSQKSSYSYNLNDKNTTC